MKIIIAMFKSLLFALAVLAVVVVGSSDPSVSIDGILDLTPTNFDEVVGSDKGVLVEFYAPWCGHCKNLVPVLGQLGAAIKSSGTQKVAVAKVDADAHSALGSRFSVTGFPTIKYFPAGSTTPEDYKGGRDAESFIKFLNGKTNAGLFLPKVVSAVTTLNSKNFDSIALDKTKNVLVKFYAPWCGHCKTLAPKYEVVAKTFAGDKNVVIASLNADEAENRGIGSKYDVQGFPTLKFFPAGSDEPIDYEGGREAQSFVDYINEKAGTKRLLGGDLAADAGLVEELTELAKKFAAEPTKTVRDEIAAVGTAAAEKYAKVADKILENAGYVAKELARLEKVLAGKVTVARKDDMQIRRNILNAFKN